MKKLAALILLLVFAVTAFADQAAYVEKHEAERAVELLSKKGQFKEYCAPCDDKTIYFEEIETIEAIETDTEDYWEVKINSEGVDLAYIYFPDKKGRWKNVAIELDIEVSDVPKFLPDEGE